tara:strand:- start:1310 stop:1801 length:492 start_codon:yes stop_codon:yes gene_type:complete
MNFKIFLEKNFIKYMFFSLTGRIGRSYWWFSQIYLILVSFVIASLISPLEIALLNIVFNLIFTAAGFFVSAKRLQDLGIDGLFALTPMIFAIYASYVIGVDKIVNSGLENLSSFDQALFWVFSLSVLILFILEAFIPGKNVLNKFGNHTDEYVEKFIKSLTNT